MFSWCALITWSRNLCGDRVTLTLITSKEICWQPIPTILKFYLHIDREEQRERFQERVDIPEKNWKFSFEDLEKRKQWDDYMVAYEEMLEETTTVDAPWYVIPANQNWYRNLAIERVIVDTLRELDPQFPIQTDDLSGVVVE